MRHAQGRTKVAFLSAGRTRIVNDPGSGWPELVKAASRGSPCLFGTARDWQSASLPSAGRLGVLLVLALTPGTGQMLKGRGFRKACHQSTPSIFYEPSCYQERALAFGSSGSAFGKFWDKALLKSVHLRHLHHPLIAPHSRLACERACSKNVHQVPVVTKSGKCSNLIKKPLVLH